MNPSLPRPKVRKQPPKGRGTRVHEDKKKAAAKRAARGKHLNAVREDLQRTQIGPTPVLSK